MTERHPLANALIVVDMQWDSKIPEEIPDRIHKYITRHTDEYVVIVATKRAAHYRFHPALHAIPDVAEPYAADNVDFDSIFVGLDKLKNVHDERLFDTYLPRRKIGHVDIVGVNVRDIAFAAKKFGYNATVLLDLCAGDVTPELILELAERDIGTSRQE